MIQKGHMDIVRLLIGIAGASYGIKNNEGLTAFAQKRFEAIALHESAGSSTSSIEALCWRLLDYDQWVSSLQSHWKSLELGPGMSHVYRIFLNNSREAASKNNNGESV